jgi:hypothetical protein
MASQKERWRGKGLPSRPARFARREEMAKLADGQY